MIKTVEGGATRREAAEIFEVSVSSAVRWVQRFVATGSAAAKPSGGSTSPLERHAERLLALVAEYPDLTLDEIVAAMHKQRIKGSRTAVWRFFERHKITFKKKSMLATERDREDVARERRRWIRKQRLLDPAKLVFIHETATTTNLARLRGRCPRGIRLIGRVPQGHWETLTFVAGLCHDGIVAPFVIEGPMNGETFLTYIQQSVVPTLEPGRPSLLTTSRLTRSPGCGKPSKLWASCRSHRRHGGLVRGGT